MKIDHSGPFYHILYRKVSSTLPSQMDEDFQRLSRTLETVSKDGTRIHCFCLMPNHYHLFLEIPKSSLHAVLSHLDFYEESFNGRKEGRFPGGRYRVSPITSRIDLIEVSRSIHLSPVRASLVNEPSQYPWSSYFAYLALEMKWNWLHIGFILGQLGRDEEEAQQRYRCYVWGAVRKLVQKSSVPAPFPAGDDAGDVGHPNL